MSSVPLKVHESVAEAIGVLNETGKVATCIVKLPKLALSGNQVTLKAIASAQPAKQFSVKGLGRASSRKPLYSAVTLRTSPRKKTQTGPNQTNFLDKLQHVISCAQSVLKNCDGESASSTPPIKQHIHPDITSVLHSAELPIATPLHFKENKPSPQSRTFRARKHCQASEKRTIMGKAGTKFASLGDLENAIKLSSEDLDYISTITDDVTEKKSAKIMFSQHTQSAEKGDECLNNTNNDKSLRQSEKNSSPNSTAFTSSVLDAYLNSTSTVDQKPSTVKPLKKMLNTPQHLAETNCKKDTVKPDIDEVDGMIFFSFEDEKVLNAHISVHQQKAVSCDSDKFFEDMLGVSSNDQSLLASGMYEELGGEYKYYLAILEHQVNIDSENKYLANLKASLIHKQNKNKSVAAALFGKKRKRPSEFDCQKRPLSSKKKGKLLRILSPGSVNKAVTAVKPYCNKSCQTLCPLMRSHNPYFESEKRKTSKKRLIVPDSHHQCRNKAKKTSDTEEVGLIDSSAEADFQEREFLKSYGKSSCARTSIYINKNKRRRNDSGEGSMSQKVRQRKQQFATIKEDTYLQQIHTAIKGNSSHFATKSKPISKQMVLLQPNYNGNFLLEISATYDYDGDRNNILSFMANLLKDFNPKNLKCKAHIGNGCWVEVSGISEVPQVIPNKVQKTNQLHHLYPIKLFVYKDDPDDQVKETERKGIDSHEVHAKNTSKERLQINREVELDKSNINVKMHTGMSSLAHVNLTLSPKLKLSSEFKQPGTTTVCISPAHNGGGLKVVSEQNKTKRELLFDKQDSVDMLQYADENSENIKTKRYKTSHKLTASQIVCRNKEQEKQQVVSKTDVSTNCQQATTNSYIIQRGSSSLCSNKKFSASSGQPSNASSLLATAVVTTRDNPLSSDTEAKIIGTRITNGEKVISVAQTNFSDGESSKPKSLQSALCCASTDISSGILSVSNKHPRPTSHPTLPVQPQAIQLTRASGLSPGTYLIHVQPTNSMQAPTFATPLQMAGPAMFQMQLATPQLHLRNTVDSQPGYRRIFPAIKSANKSLLIPLMQPEPVSAIRHQLGMSSGAGAHIAINRSADARDAGATSNPTTVSCTTGTLMLENQLLTPPSLEPKNRLSKTNNMSNHTGFTIVKGKLIPKNANRLHLKNDKLIPLTCRQRHAAKRRKKVSAGESYHLKLGKTCKGECEEMDDITHAPTKFDSKQQQYFPVKTQDSDVLHPKTSSSVDVEQSSQTLMNMLSNESGKQPMPTDSVEALRQCPVRSDTLKTDVMELHTAPYVTAVGHNGPLYAMSGAGTALKGRLSTTSSEICRFDSPCPIVPISSVVTGNPGVRNLKNVTTVCSIVKHDKVDDSIILTFRKTGSHSLLSNETNAFGTARQNIMTTLSPLNVLIQKMTESSVSVTDSDMHVGTSSTHTRFVDFTKGRDKNQEKDTRVGNMSEKVVCKRSDMLRKSVDEFQPKIETHTPDTLRKLASAVYVNAKSPKHRTCVMDGESTGTFQYQYQQDTATVAPVSKLRLLADNLAKLIKDKENGQSALSNKFKPNEENEPGKEEKKSVSASKKTYRNLEYTPSTWAVRKTSLFIPISQYSENIVNTDQEQSSSQSECDSNPCQNNGGDKMLSNVHTEMTAVKAKKGKKSPCIKTKQKDHCNQEYTEHENYASKKDQQ